MTAKVMITDNETNFPVVVYEIFESGTYEIGTGSFVIRGKDIEY